LIRCLRKRRRTDQPRRGCRHLRAPRRSTLAAMFAIDHVAYPCFDVRATVRFWTDVMGGTLRHAQSGPAPEWRAEAYLLMAFELPGGVVVDFFAFDGLRRPDGGKLPRDIQHIGISMATRAEVLRFM